MHLVGSKRCETGWLWNSYTKLCVKIFPTKAKGNDASVKCTQLASRVDDSDVYNLLGQPYIWTQMLLKSLMSHPSSKCKSNDLYENLGVVSGFLLLYRNYYAKILSCLPNEKATLIQ